MAVYALPIIGLLALAWAWNFYHHQVLELRQLRTYGAMHPETEVPRPTTEQRAALRAMGFFGPSRRLERIEGLRHMARLLQLPSLRYALTARDELEQLAGLQHGSLRFETLLRNEVELLWILNMLRATLSGLPRLRECVLRRRGPDGEVRSAWLEARCEMHWYTWVDAGAAAAGRLP